MARIYNLLFGACACAFLRIGSNFVASVTGLAFPVHKSRNHQRTHHVALHLQFPAHEQLLRVRLARDQLLELGIVEHKRDGGLFALRRYATAHCASLLQVDVPRLFFAVVLECEGEDGSAGLDGGFAVGGRGGEGGLDCVEGGRGGEVVWTSISYGVGVCDVCGSPLVSWNGGRGS